MNLTYSWKNSLKAFDLDVGSYTITCTIFLVDWTTERTIIEYYPTLPLQLLIKAWWYGRRFFWCSFPASRTLVYWSHQALWQKAIACGHQQWFGSYLWVNIPHWVTTTHIKGAEIFHAYCTMNCAAISTCNQKKNYAGWGSIQLNGHHRESPSTHRSQAHSKSHPKESSLWRRSFASDIVSPSCWSTFTYAIVSSSPFSISLVAMRWSCEVPLLNEGRTVGVHEWLS